MHENAPVKIVRLMIHDAFASVICYLHAAKIYVV